MVWLKLITRFFLPAAEVAGAVVAPEVAVPLEVASVAGPAMVDGVAAAATGAETIGVGLAGNEGIIGAAARGLGFGEKAASNLGPFRSVFSRVLGRGGAVRAGESLGAAEETALHASRGMWERIITTFGKTGIRWASVTAGFTAVVDEGMKLIIALAKEGAGLVKNPYLLGAGAILGLGYMFKDKVLPSAEAAKIPSPMPTAAALQSDTSLNPFAANLAASSVIHQSADSGISYFGKLRETSPTLAQAISK